MALAPGGAGRGLLAAPAGGEAGGQQGGHGAAWEEEEGRTPRGRGRARHRGRKPRGVRRAHPGVGRRLPGVPKGHRLRCPPRGPTERQEGPPYRLPEAPLRVRSGPRAPGPGGSGKRAADRRVRRRQVLTDRPSRLGRAPPPGAGVTSVRTTSGAGGGRAEVRAKLGTARRRRGRPVTEPTSPARGKPAPGRTNCWGGGGAGATIGVHPAVGPLPRRAGSTCYLPAL